MNELDALISGVEALERSTHDKLLAAGEDPRLLAELAAEVVDAQEPTDDERAAFGLVYRIVMGLAFAALAEPERAPLLDPTFFLRHVEDKNWVYDEHEGAVLHVSEPAHGWPERRPFTPMATSSEDLLFYLDHVADLVGDQAYRARTGMHHQAYRNHVLRTLRQFKLAAQFERDDHLPAQIHQSAHHCRRQRNRPRTS